MYYCQVIEKGYYSIKVILYNKKAMDKIKEQTRLRQKKFYEKNRSSILQKRKEKRIVKKEVVIEEVIIREKIDLDKVINRIENVLQNGNEITMKTHIQRMKIVHRLTDFNDLETDLFDYGKMIDCIEIGTYGKLNKVYKNNKINHFLSTILHTIMKLLVNGSISWQVLTFPLA